MKFPSYHGLESIHVGLVPGVPETLSVLTEFVFEPDHGLNFDRGVDVTF